MVATAMGTVVAGITAIITDKDMGSTFNSGGIERCRPLLFGSCDNWEVIRKTLSIVDREGVVSTG